MQGVPWEKYAGGGHEKKYADGGRRSKNMRGDPKI